MRKKEWMVKTMLLQFKFKNFKSFAEETILDLMATNIKEHINCLNEKNGIKVLPVAAIFGANASGKSNLFQAFFSMRLDVLNEYNKNQKHFLIKPYIFNKNLEKKPTEYEVCINIEDEEYRYGFSRDQEHVYEEWLFTKKFAKSTRAKEKLVFYRNNKKLEIGKLSQRESVELEYVSSMVDEKELLITAIGKRDKSKYAKVFKWFLATCQFQDFSSDYDEFINTSLAAEFLYEHQEYLNDVIGLLKEFDNSIYDIKIRVEKDAELNDIYKIYSYHLDNKGNKVEVPFESESSGTQKLFSIATLLFFSLNLGIVLWIDELDSKLHPLILRYIIRLFCDKKLNTGNGQLVFSSHNLVCLDSSDLRRDEIWFVEKDKQVSTLYSLYDFKEDEASIRSDLNFGKHYLSGRFGAIPFQDGR